MFFGLRNAPETFQRSMDVILASVKWYFSLVYLGDVVIFFNNPYQPISNLKVVLNLLKKAGIMIKLKKCFSFHKKIDNLGHVIIPSYFGVAHQETDTIRKMKDPKNVTELR